MVSLEEGKRKYVTEHIKNMSILVSKLSAVDPIETSHKHYSTALSLHPDT